MEKAIERFEVKLGDIALTRVSKNKIPFIEVALFERPEQRCLYTLDTKKLVSSNIPEDLLPYVHDKVVRNARFLEV